VIAAVLILGAYLIGAVPFGLLIGLARGVDVREQGSHNIGSTNVGRILGRRWGFLCLSLDIAKGFIPILIGTIVLTNSATDSQRQAILAAAALAAVLGHVFPVYLGFRGGRGVNTTIGVALGLWPYYTVAILVALAAYGIVRFTTRTVSAGSLVLAIVFPLAFYLHVRIAKISVTDYWPLLAIAITLALIIILRHRDNIRRLVQGKELGIKM